MIAAGLALLAAFPQFAPPGFPLRLSYGPWLLLMGCLSATILHRGYAAVVRPTPGLVQRSVKHCLLSLIMLDASVVLQVSPPLYGLALVLLMVPSAWLGWWVYST